MVQLLRIMRKHSDELDCKMIALQKAQQLFGYLPLEVHKHISARTGISVAELYGVSTFYSQFLLEAEGKHRISAFYNELSHPPMASHSDGKAVGGRKDAQQAETA